MHSGLVCRRSSSRCRCCNSCSAWGFHDKEASATYDKIHALKHEAVLHVWERARPQEGAEPCAAASRLCSLPPCSLRACSDDHCVSTSLCLDILAASSLTVLSRARSPSTWLRSASMSPCQVGQDVRSSPPLTGVSRALQA